ncbi:hypothetical protein F4680DRAFT_447799 [Xylaria scruposa]|nr:hypothetical protein F4680DRAFT_447799 [Xylaria scruposa]
MADVNDQQPQMEEDRYAQLKGRVDELEKELHKKTAETNELNKKLHKKTAEAYEAIAQLRIELNTRRRFKITAHLTDEEYNEKARKLNNRIKTDLCSIIHPLKNTTTHQIVFLPPTLGDFIATSNDDAKRYLRELGQELYGVGLFDDYFILGEYIGLDMGDDVRTLYES